LNNYNFVIIISTWKLCDSQWDEAKNLSNQRKHGVSFEKASAEFLDPLFTYRHKIASRMGNRVGKPLAWSGTFSLSQWPTPSGRNVMTAH
jgi:hypothetical protein